MNWTVKRGDQQFQAESIGQLQQWAQEGRVVKSDYIYNPVLEQWLYASDVKELAGQFQEGKTAERTRREAEKRRRRKMDPVGEARRERRKGALIILLICGAVGLYYLADLIDESPEEASQRRIEATIASNAEEYRENRKQILSRMESAVEGNADAIQALRDAKKFLVAVDDPDLIELREQLEPIAKAEKEQAAERARIQERERKAAIAKQNSDAIQRLTEKIEEIESMGTLMPRNYKAIIDNYNRLAALDPTKTSQYNASASRHERELRRFEENFSGWDGAHISLERLIKRNMNDPDSFEHIDTRFAPLQDDLLEVTMWFRGRNAFGGLVRNSVTAEVHALNGNVVRILSQEP